MESRVLKRSSVIVFVVFLVKSDCNCLIITPLYKDTFIYVHYRSRVWGQSSDLVLCLTLSMVLNVIPHVLNDTEWHQKRTCRLQSFNSEYCKH